LEAVKHHLETASRHLAAVNKYGEGDIEGAEAESDEARMASLVADCKSVDAHRQSVATTQMKLMGLGESFPIRWR
jgi:hypothetical protein